MDAAVDAVTTITLSSLSLSFHAAVATAMDSVTSSMTTDVEITTTVCYGSSFFHAAAVTASNYF